MVLFVNPISPKGFWLIPPSVPSPHPESRPTSSGKCFATGAPSLEEEEVGECDVVVFVVVVRGMTDCRSGMEGGGLSLPPPPALSKKKYSLKGGNGVRCILLAILLAPGNFSLSSPPCPPSLNSAFQTRPHPLYLPLERIAALVQWRDSGKLALKREAAPPSAAAADWRIAQSRLPSLPLAGLGTRSGTN